MNAADVGPVIAVSLFRASQGIRVRLVAREAAIEVVRQRLGTESQLMVRRIVRRAGDGRWLTRPRPRAVHRYPLTCIVVTVVEGPQRASAEFVGQPRQLRGRVVSEFCHDPVW